MNSWAPLSDGLVDSSIWEEPDHVFRVFIGMMSIKDHTHVVRKNTYELSRRLHMNHEVVLDALKVLSSPDARRPGQPHNGRRIEAVDGGWVLLNGEAYKAKVQLIMKRARDARAQANYRARKAGKPLPYPRANSSGAELSKQELDAHEDVRRSVQNLSKIQSGAEVSDLDTLGVSSQDGVGK